MRSFEAWIINWFKVICLKNSFCLEIFLLNILPVKKIGCIFAHNKRTFKKHFPFFGIVYYATITLPLHTPLPKEIHSLICWCISPIKMIFRINCFSSLIIIKHKTKLRRWWKSHNGRKKSRKDVSATRTISKRTIMANLYSPYCKWEL